MTKDSTKNTLLYAGLAGLVLVIIGVIVGWKFSAGTAAAAALLSGARRSATRTKETVTNASLDASSTAASVDAMIETSKHDAEQQATRTAGERRESWDNSHTSREIDL